MDETDDMKNVVPVFEIEPEDLEYLIPLSKQKERFERILLKTRYEAKTQYLFDKLKNNYTCYYRSTRYKNAQKKYFTDRKCVSELLMMCKTEGLTALKGNKTIKLTASISAFIESVLEEKYKMYGLHYEPMTFAEGKEILEKKLSNDVRDFVSDYWRQYAEMNGISEDEMQGCLDQIDDEMIETYIEGNECPREINQEQIERTLNRLDRAIKHYKKKGAPTKNYKLHAAVLEFNNIGLLKPTSEDYEIMYECCDCFGLIDEKLKKGWEIVGSYQPNIAYMKSVWKEALKAKQARLLFYD